MTDAQVASFLFNNTATEIPVEEFGKYSALSEDSKPKYFVGFRQAKNFTKAVKHYTSCALAVDGWRVVSAQHELKRQNEYEQLSELIDAQSAIFKATVHFREACEKFSSILELTTIDIAQYAIYSNDALIQEIEKLNWSSYPYRKEAYEALYGIVFPPKDELDDEHPRATHKSLKAFVEFLNTETLARARYFPDIYICPEGHIRASWKKGEHYLAIRFIDYDNLLYVMFAPGSQIGKINRDTGTRDGLSAEKLLSQQKWLFK